jgi:hypothetical protein
VQKPEPVPQPLPPDWEGLQPTNPQQPDAQSFSGTIVKKGIRYILKVSANNVYQLDDQEKAKRYEGKQVKIEGTLDPNGNSLHITSIELLS